MKKTIFKALLSLLCTLTLLLGVVPLAVFQTAAVGTDFPWTKEDTLLEKIMQRDGLLKADRNHFILYTSESTYG